MTAIRGAAAAVTGAASGIGRALALELAARGCGLALADRDDAGLATLAAEINRAGSQKVTVRRVDVGKPQQIEDFAQAAIADHPRTQHHRQQCRRGADGRSTKSAWRRWTG